MSDKAIPRDEVNARIERLAVTYPAVINPVWNSG